MYTCNSSYRVAKKAAMYRNSNYIAVFYVLIPILYFYISVRADQAKCFSLFVFCTQRAKKRTWNDLCKLRMPRIRKMKAKRTKKKQPKHIYQKQLKGRCCAFLSAAKKRRIFIGTQLLLACRQDLCNIALCRVSFAWLLRTQGVFHDFIFVQNCGENLTRWIDIIIWGLISQRERKVI